MSKRILRGFSERLMTIIKGKDIRVKEIAKRCGVPDKELAYWLRGFSEPDLYSIVELSKVLNISTDQLLTGKQPIEDVQAYIRQAGQELADIGNKAVEILDRLKGLS